MHCGPKSLEEVADLLNIGFIGSEHCLQLRRHRFANPQNSEPLAVLELESVVSTPHFIPQLPRATSLLIHICVVNKHYGPPAQFGEPELEFMSDGIVGGLPVEV